MKISRAWKAYRDVGFSGYLDGFRCLVPGFVRPWDGMAEFDDPADASQYFAPHYERLIKPKVEVFEENRLKAIDDCRRRHMLVLPAVVAIFAGAIWAIIEFHAPQYTHNQKELAELLIYGSFFVATLFLAWASYPVVVYRQSVKSDIFPDVFSFFGPEFSYNPNGLIDMDEIEPSGIVPSYDYYHIEDGIKGRYKGVDLKISELKLREERGSGKNRRTVTTFKGIAVILEAHKDFSGWTIVRKDQGFIANFVSSKLGTLSRKKSAELENVRLEDPEFEKMFEVYGTDQIEARFLLTTSFMQRLLDLKNALDGKGLQCAFYQKKLLIMVSSKHNYFETSSVCEPATFVNDINIILREMAVIFDIINILKLHERTGL